MNNIMSLPEAVAGRTGLAAGCGEFDPAGGTATASIASRPRSRHSGLENDSPAAEFQQEGTGTSDIETCEFSMSYQP